MNSISFILKKSKNPRNGWTLKLYVDSFGLVDDGLVRVIEKTCIDRTILGAINPNFLGSIQEQFQLATFNDFRHISMYNVVHKMIEKVIANQIKVGLSRKISRNNLDFFLITKFLMV